MSHPTLTDSIRSPTSFTGNFMPRADSAQIVICGAGIAGVATAWALARKGLGDRVLVIDRNAPLSLTTAVSGENFRNFWPQAPMRALSEHSIELMRKMKTEGASFKLAFSGYEFISRFPQSNIFDFGSGDVDAVEHIGDPHQLESSRPYLSREIASVTRSMNAGSLDVHALGSDMLAAATKAGVTRDRSEITGVETSDGSFRVHCRDLSGSTKVVACETFVIAAGAFSRRLARSLGADLPLYNTVQRKCIMPDPAGVIPRDMPFTIIADAMHLPFDDGERDLLTRDPDYAWLTREFPPGLHIKPEPGGRIKMGWAFNTTASEPAWQVDSDDLFPEIVLRGASRYFPGLEKYVDAVPMPISQLAGQYCRTPENWPLIGPLGVEGAYTVSGLSGFGTMMAAACGDLCSAWITGEGRPAHARYFSPGRYDDDHVASLLGTQASDGQL